MAVKQIKKSGNGLVLRLSPEFCEDNGIVENTPVKVEQIMKGVFKVEVVKE